MEYQKTPNLSGNPLGTKTIPRFIASDAYIVIKGTVTIDGEENRDQRNRKSVFKSRPTFIVTCCKTAIL